MIKRLATNIARHYSDKNVIKSTEQDVYIYGFELVHLQGEE